MIPRRVIIIYHYCSLWKACVSVVPDVYLPQCQCYGNKLTSNCQMLRFLPSSYFITTLPCVERCLGVCCWYITVAGSSVPCVYYSGWFLACYNHLCLSLSGGVTVTPISLSTTLRVSPPTFVTAAAELRRLAAPGAHQLSTNQTAKAFTSPSGKF